MDTERAFIMAQIARAVNAPMRYFNWEKAAHLINDYGIKDATAGLAEDLEWTEDIILKDGKPVLDSQPYLSSCWATPILRSDIGEFECCTFEEPSTVNTWTQKALAILNQTGD